MKKEPLALGLILIIIGLVLLYFSGAVVIRDDYTPKANVDNDFNLREGNPLVLNVSASFTSGQRFFFNFTKGRYWGVQYDQLNGMEPAMSNFAPNASIMPYKVAEFYIYTPSNDMVLTEVYLVGGTQIYSVVYLNQSADFTPLDGNNCTFYNVGVEGLAKTSGYYTLRINDISPSVMWDQTHFYNISSDANTGDPPVTMTLWNFEIVPAKPYLVMGISAGALIMGLGTVLSVWASTYRVRRHHSPNSKRNHRHS